MSLVLEGDDLIELHQSEGHGFIFDYNVEPSYFGIANRAIQINTDITAEHEDKRIRNAIRIGECVRCRTLQNDRNPDGCLRRPKVTIS